MDNNSNNSRVTQLIAQLAEGDRSVIETITPLVYDQLRQMASMRLRNDRLNHSVSPTMLVHETYLKLVGQDNLDLKNKSHFLAIAAIAMRRILVDYARMRHAKKRGGDQFDITFNEEEHVQTIGSDGLLALNDALNELRESNSRQATIIEYWFFGGLTHKEIAAVLEISVPTVRKDWRISRAWLAAKLTK